MTAVLVLNTLIKPSRKRVRVENRSLQRQLAELDGYGIIQDSVDGAFELWRYDTFIGIEYNAKSEEDAWESALDEIIPN